VFLGAVEFKRGKDKQPRKKRGKNSLVTIAKEGGISTLKGAGKGAAIGGTLGALAYGGIAAYSVRSSLKESASRNAAGIVGLYGAYRGVPIGLKIGATVGASSYVLKKLINHRKNKEETHATKN
jgi:hypothetical protein